MILNNMPDTACIWGDKQHAIKGLSLDEFTQVIRSRLTGKVIELYVFGSFARGEQNPQSDIDLIAITETQLSFQHRGSLFPEIYELTNNIDLLIFTPEEWNKITLGENPFWQHVLNNIKKII